MALVDVSFLLEDPDFVDDITLIRRESYVSSQGNHQIFEISYTTIKASVQDGSGAGLLKQPELAQLDEVIVIYSKTPLSAQRVDGYADKVEWKGQKYIVFDVEDWGHFGAGWTKAHAKLEKTFI